MATPATFKQRLASARPGETIRLAPGDYGAVTLPARTWSPAIRLEAGGAQFAGLVLRNVQGVMISGGAIIGPGGRSYGISMRGAGLIRIENMRISGAHRGVVVAESSDIALIGNELTGLKSDGINIALSRRVLVQRNRCFDFSPAMAVFDAAGKRLRDGDHPDCIQAWSRPSHPPVSDVQVLDNEAVGIMQGIFFGNHVRGGIDDGGFDRVIIRGNRLRVALNALVLSGGRDSVVRDNIVEQFPGMIFPSRPNLRIKSSIRVFGNGTLVCGNVVRSGGTNPGATRC